MWGVGGVRVRGRGPGRGSLCGRGPRAPAIGPERMRSANFGGVASRAARPHFFARTVLCLCTRRHIRALHLSLPCPCPIGPRARTSLLHRSIPTVVKTRLQTPKWLLQKVDVPRPLVLRQHKRDELLPELAVRLMGKEVEFQER